MEGKRNITDAIKNETIKILKTDKPKVNNEKIAKQLKNITLIGAIAYVIENWSLVNIVTSIVIIWLMIRLNPLIIRMVEIAIEKM